VEGRCCLHYAAGYGHEECVDVLLAKAGNEAVKVRDSNGDLPLHLAAQQGHPMCAYNIAKVSAAVCVIRWLLPVTQQRGMLLGCVCFCSISCYFLSVLIILTAVRIAYGTIFGSVIFTGLSAAE
jgi:hypothetical protein